MHGFGPPQGRNPCILLASDLPFASICCYTAGSRDGLEVVDSGGIHIKSKKLNQFWLKTHGFRKLRIENQRIYGCHAQMSERALENCWPLPAASNHDRSQAIPPQNHPPDPKSDGFSTFRNHLLYYRHCAKLFFKNMFIPLFEYSKWPPPSQNHCICKLFGISIGNSKQNCLHLKSQDARSTQDR